MSVLTGRLAPKDEAPRVAAEGSEEETAGATSSTAKGTAASPQGEASERSLVVPNPDVGSLRDGALRLAADHGLRVFPLVPAGKDPAVPGGHHRASNDPAQVERWWAERANLNVGMALHTNGLVLIDVDGPAGEATMAALGAKHGPLPRTWTVRSGRAAGGSHRFYSVAHLPADARMRGILGDGVDVKHNGYSVCPPSVHPVTGARYEWLVAPWDLAAPARLPEEWERLVVREAVEPKARPADVPTLAPGEVATSFGKAALRSALRRLEREAAPGNRNRPINACAFTVGGLVAAGQVDERWATQQVLDAAYATGHDPRSCEATVESGIRGGQSVPLYPPPDWTAEPPRLRAPSRSDEGRDSDEPPAPMTCTDTANALRFADAKRERVRWNDDRGEWLLWDGARWLRSRSDTRVQAEAQEVARCMVREAEGIADHDDRTRFLKWAASSQSQQRVAAMASMAKPHLLVAEDALDADPYALNCANGTLDLRTLTLRPHDPDDLLTRTTGVAYVPDAQAPEWERFLSDVLPDPEVRAFVQRLAGVTLLGEVREHVLPLMLGTGANGKGVYLETLAHVLGDYATTVDVGLLLRAGDRRDANAPTPALMPLRGTRFVYAQEGDVDERLAEGTVKWLTGGDTLSGRVPHAKGMETWRPSHTLYVATNAVPRVRGTDEGIWRRLLLVRWPVHVPRDQQDPSLRARIVEHEAEGVLAWAVRGYVEYVAQGLNPPASVLADTRDYREQSDRLAGFLTDCCEVGDDLRAEPAALHEAYEEWCEANAEQPVARNTFGAMLEERGYRQGKSNGRRVRKGLALREDRPRAPRLRPSVRPDLF